MAYVYRNINGAMSILYDKKDSEELKTVLAMSAREYEAYKEETERFRDSFEAGIFSPDTRTREYLMSTTRCPIGPCISTKYINLRDYYE